MEHKKKPPRCDDWGGSKVRLATVQIDTSAQQNRNRGILTLFLSGLQGCLSCCHLSQ